MPPLSLLFRRCAVLVSLTLMAAAQQMVAQGVRPLCAGCGGGGSGVFSITPDGGSLSSTANTTGLAVAFTATNGTGTVKNITFTCSSSGPVNCAGVSPSSYGFDPAESTTVTVTYATGAPGGGTLTLTGSGGATDAGWYSIDVTGPPPPPAAPVVALRNANADNLDRSLCLTSGAGEAGAWQCGDLLVGHSTPSYATMGKERALTLVYNSGTAHPEPVAVAAVTQSGSSPPTSVYAELKVNPGAGYVVVASATYPGWSSGTRQVGLAWDASAYATGRYPYTLEIRNQSAGGVTSTTVSGFLMTVNRSYTQSLPPAFGSGWALAGVEQIIGQADNTLLWIGGDGSIKHYGLAPGNTWGRWVAPAGAYRDTLTWEAGLQRYVRHLKHGIEVRYNLHGLHAETVGRTGQMTRFIWDTTAWVITSIKVPPNGVSGTTYTLSYTSGRLTQITDPAGRRTVITISPGGQLTSVVDPDTAVATGFGYDAANRMTSRTTRRGYTTSFKYDNNLRVTRVIVPGTLAAGDTTAFQPWDEKGLGSAAGGPLAVDTASAFTRILGPRVNVADDATFWIDQWGAPVRIVNALGQTTTLTRGDPAVPALVTRDSQPDGRVYIVKYNARANLIETRDSTPPPMANPVATAVNQWFYNSPNAQDSPDSIVDAAGIATLYRYNAQWGLDSLAIAPNGHVTRFEDKGPGSADSLFGLVRAVTELNVPVWDSAQAQKVIAAAVSTRFGFGALGNVVSDTSPMGKVRSYVRDNRQLVITTFDGAGYRRDFTYDNMGRMTRSILHGELPGSTDTARYPADSGVLKPDTTAWTYTLGLLTSVRDPRGVVREYGYDPAGRRITETDDFGKVDSTWFGPDGLVDSTRSRALDPQRTHGVKVRNRYDAGGRLLTARWEARTVYPADSVVYTYDQGNRIQSAKRFAPFRLTSRTYFANGLLKTEVDSGFQQLFRHAYTYDAGGKRLTYVIGKEADPTLNDSMAYRYNPANANLDRIYVRWRHPADNTDPIQYTQDSVRFAWDALGRRDTVVFTMGLSVRFAYDADGQTRVICGNHPAPNVIPTDYVAHSGVFNSSVDAADRVRASTVPFPMSLCGSAPYTGANWTNSYDVQGNLLSQVAAGNGVKFRYDRSGNLVTRIATSGAPDTNVFTVDPGHNRILRQFHNGSLWTAFAYDEDGARDWECVREPDPILGCPHFSSDVGYRDYYYDGLGRTAGVFAVDCYSWSGSSVVDGTPIASFSCASASGPSTRDCGYDAVGRLDHPCEKDAPAALGFDGQSVTRTGDDATAFGWTFVHGPGTDDPLLAYYPGGSTRNFAYFITDGAGRQFAVMGRDGVSLLGGSGSQIQSAYQNSGGRYSGATAASTTFGADRFNGAAHSGLVSFRNRFYDQATGRWTQEDPIGLAGGINLYQFSGNNPVAFTDPFGLCPPCSEREEGWGDNDPGLADPTSWIGPAEVKLGAALVIGIVADVGKVAAKTGIERIVAGLTEHFGAPVEKVAENGAKRLEFTASKDGTKMIVRGPETHPIPGSDGKPVTHYNVEVHEPTGKPGRFKKVENTHLDESGRVLDP